MKKALLIIVASVAAILVCIFTAMGVENKAISLEEHIENTTGNIRVGEKRRFGLLLNLVDCVKQYDLYEYNTLMDVIYGRATGDGVPSSVEEIKTIIAAVAEAYTDLKSQKNYQELMNEMSITENKIVEMRKFYNRNVTEYKRFVRQFPSKQILGLRGYEIKYYECLEFEDNSADASKNLFD